MAARRDNYEDPPAPAVGADYAVYRVDSCNLSEESIGKCIALITAQKNTGNIVELVQVT